MFVYPNHDWNENTSNPEWKTRLTDRRRMDLTSLGFAKVEHDPEGLEFVRKDPTSGLALYITIPRQPTRDSIRACFAYICGAGAPHYCDVDARLADGLLRGHDNSTLLVNFTA